MNKEIYNENNVSEIKNRQQNIEKNLKLLRVSNSTVILVPEHKCTPEYAEKYRREKMGLNY